MRQAVRRIAAVVRQVHPVVRRIAVVTRQVRQVVHRLEVVRTQAVAVRAAALAVAVVVHQAAGARLADK